LQGLLIKENKRSQRRILHTSDLHLTWLGDKECHNLVAVADLATQMKVDLLLVVGDLFESARVEDDVVRFVAGQFQRLPMPVAILPGNHDCLVTGSAYGRRELWQKCANVHIFREPNGGILTLPDMGLTLWGKPILSYDDDVRPLAGIPRPQSNGQWHIALAHGYYVTNPSPYFTSYNITREDIVTSGWDYIALGHVVTFECVCEEPVKAYYCGSPSQTGGVAIVDLAEETGVQVNRYSLSTK
jgi:DNA repair exonuclease SbcCD nuclease subunit